MAKKTFAPRRVKGSSASTKPSESAALGKVDEAALIADLRDLIQSARERVATVANAAQTLLYWRLGRRLVKENLQDRRAPYGKPIVVTVSRQLGTEFVFQLFPDETIVSTLSTQLSWSHFLELLPIKDPLARDFYAEMCRIERWDVRALRKKIGGMLFHRTALSRNTKEVISAEIGQLRNGRVIPEAVFRHPYFLDFLGLKGAYSERDLEAAILREMETFLRTSTSTCSSITGSSVAWSPSS